MQWNSRKKEGAPTLRDSMEGSGEHYAKWNTLSQAVKDKYHKMKLFTINRNLINKMKKQSIAKDIEIENTLIVNRDGGRGGDNGGKG